MHLSYSGDQRALESTANLKEQVPLDMPKPGGHGFVITAFVDSDHEWRTEHVPTDENQSDLLTKPLPAGIKRETLVAKVLHHVYDKVNGVEYGNIV